MRPNQFKYSIKISKCKVHFPCLKQMFKILYKTCVMGHHFSIVIAGVFSRVQINISRFSKFPKFIKKLFITTFKSIKPMKLQGVQDITSNSCNNLGKSIPTTSSLGSLLLQNPQPILQNCVGVSKYTTGSPKIQTRFMYH